MSTEEKIYRLKKEFERKERGVELLPIQRAWIKRHIKSNRVMFGGYGGFVFIRVLLELLSPFIVYYMSSEIVLRGISADVFGHVAIYVTTYLIVSSLAIYFEKRNVFQLVNSIRFSWFRRYMYNMNRVVAVSEIGLFLAKISYQLTLINSSYTPVVSGLFKTTCLLVIVTLYILTIKVELIWLVVVIVFILSLILIAGKLIVENLIVKEQTLSSTIVQYLVESLGRRYYLRRDSLIDKRVSRFAKLVELDTVIRTRRSFFMDYSFAFLYVTVILGSIIAFVYRSELIAYISQVEDRQILPITVFVGLFVNYLYTALRAGLNIYPLYLGLCLVTPDYVERVGTSFPVEVNKIVFRVKKYYPYINHKPLRLQNYVFNAGDRVAFIKQEHGGDNKLFKILSGTDVRSGAGWYVTVNGKRHSYAQWLRKYDIPYSIVPQDNERRIVEIITGKVGDMLYPVDFINVNEWVHRVPELAFIDRIPLGLRTVGSSSYLSMAEMCLVQLAGFLYQQRSILLLDPIYSTMNHPAVDSMLKQVSTNNKSSIIICFYYGNHNSSLAFTQTHHYIN